MRNLFFPGCGIIISSVLILFGVFLLFVFPTILNFFTTKEFRMSPTSTRYKNWKKAPLPMTFDVYLFNWTNPELIAKEKPVFTELGPYRFYEVRDRVNISWNENDTLTFQQSRTWHFNAEESNGSLDDQITTINGVTLTAAYQMRHSGYIQQQSLSMAFGFTKQRIWTTQAARDLLFDGYSNDLMTFANKMPIALSSPFDKFAWFYKRNGSFAIDGWFNVDTGKKNMDSLGKVWNWNFKNHTGFYEGKCGEVHGYTGDMYPPGLMGRDSRINLFSQDLCRTLPFDFASDEEVLGVPGLKYASGLHLVDNGWMDPDNTCYCNGECVPSGFLNLTVCRFGAPVFVSFPHFYDANTLYLKKVVGLQPEKKRHEFYITVEPTYGIPIDVAARVQINMLVQPINHINMYRNVPKLMFPVLWVDQRVRITDSVAREIRLVLMLPTLASVGGVTSLLLGSVLLAAIIYLKTQRKKDKSQPVKQPPTAS